MPDSIVKETLREIVPLDADELIGPAARRVIDAGLPALPAVEKDGRFAGIFGEREFMAALFPGDPLPEIFTPPAEIRASTAVLPLEVRVHYGAAPLVALLGGGLALLAAAGAAAWAYGRPRRVTLTVEDELRTVHTRAGAVQPIYDRAGQ